MSRSPPDTPSLVSAPGHEALVTGRALRVVMRGHLILDTVDISVAPGEIVTVIGPNGAGKTTLLRVLLGLLKPSHGTVERHPGLRVGYLPQRMQIDPILPLSVGRLMTLTRRSDADAIGAALAETGASHLCDAQVSTLSGGELQRVLLARALLRDPDLLALDEPVQGVDFIGEAALYELIGGIRARRGCGVLMISHDLHVVMAAPTASSVSTGTSAAPARPRRSVGIRSMSGCSVRAPRRRWPSTRITTTTDTGSPARSSGCHLRAARSRPAESHGRE